MRRHRPAASGPLPRFGRVWLVAQTVLAAAFVGFLLDRQDVHWPWAADDLTVQVAFADAAGLEPGDRAPVTIAGVPSGRVGHVSLRDGRARVELRLDPEVRGNLRAGARARIQPRSVLNDLTVELSPGAAAAPALRDGAEVAAERGAAPVQLDEIVSTLDADTRAAVQLVVAELDVGLRGRRTTPLARALRRLGPAADSTARLTRALASRRALLTRLVGHIDSLFGALGERGEDLQRVVATGRETLAVTAGRGDELAASVRKLPATLVDVREALGAVRSLARPLDPALRSLRPAARALPAGLARLRSSAPRVRALVAEVDRLATRARRPVSELRGALVALEPAARGLRSPVRRLEPVVRAIDQRKDGIGLLGERFSGIFSTNDANGVILRGLGFFEAFDPANFGVPGATGARRARVAADVVTLLTRTCLRSNEVACLARYLVPGLPGAVRTVADSLGGVRESARSVLPALLERPQQALRAGLTPALRHRAPRRGRSAAAPGAATRGGSPAARRSGRRP